MTHSSNTTPVLLSLLLVTSCATGCVYLNGNFRAVEPDAVYRSGQLSPEGLGRRLEEHNIRTVVSLRGPDPDADWHQAEKAVCEDAGTTHVDLGWTMFRIPEPASLAQLVSIYETGDYPVLVHCQGGTHRAAVASAVYVLMNGGDPNDARAQFGYHFNDAPIGQLIDLYEGSGKPFADWVRQDYPAVYQAWLDAQRAP